MSKLVLLIVLAVGGLTCAPSMSECQLPTGCAGRACISHCNQPCVCMHSTPGTATRPSVGRCVAVMPQ